MTEIDLDALPPEQALAALEATGDILRAPGTSGDVVWHCWGSGPPLVLLHGGYGSWAHWVRNVQPLSRYFRVMAADMPGFGASDDAPEPNAAETIAESLKKSLLSLIGGDEKVTVCGFSFGGVIGGHLAGQLGGRLERLVLVAPGGLGARRGPMPDLVRRNRSMSEEEVAAAHRRNLEILMVADTSCIDGLALLIQHRNTAQHRVKSRPISGTDTLARALPRVTAPVGAIWGELDATVGPYMDDRREIMTAACPHIDFRTEPDVGHWIMYEKPDRFVEILLDITGPAPSIP